MLNHSRSERLLTGNVKHATITRIEGDMPSYRLGEKGSLPRLGARAEEPLPWRKCLPIILLASVAGWGVVILLVVGLLRLIG
jgi:hypothetical protein